MQWIHSKVRHISSASTLNVHFWVFQGFFFEGVSVYNWVSNVLKSVWPAHKTEAGLLDIIEHLPIRILSEPHHRLHSELAEEKINTRELDTKKLNTSASLANVLVHAAPRAYSD